jgi:hypothetical protein
VKDYLARFQQTELGFVGFVGSPDKGFQTEIPTTGHNPESEHWKADCAQLFAEARAQVAINLANGACPDCGGGLLENKLSDERAQYCAACDFTWRAEDFAEIRATLARLNRQHERQAA